MKESVLVIALHVYASDNDQTNYKRNVDVLTAATGSRGKSSV